MKTFLSLMETSFCGQGFVSTMQISSLFAVCFVFVGLSATCGLVIGLHLTVEECYEIVAGKFFNYVLALESILGVIFS